MHLQILNGDVGETKLFQPYREWMKLRQLFDDPALAQLAVNALLQCVGEPTARKKAVGNDESSSGPQQAVRLRQQSAFVYTVRVATAFQRVNPVVACALQSGVFVVALHDADTFTATGGLV